MKKTLTLLVASTVLTAAIGIPAWSAMQTPDGSLRSFATLIEEGAQAMPLLLAGDDDEDDDRHHRKSSRRGHHHDRDRKDRHDDDHDDDDCRGGARNPSPAGSVGPPPNGLFGNGAPPQVKVN